MKVKATVVVKENKLLFALITLIPATYWLLVLKADYKSIPDAIFTTVMWLVIGGIAYWLGYKLKKSELRIEKNKNSKRRK